MRTKAKDEKYLQLLQDFQNAHQNLAEFFTEESNDSYPHISPNMYPFEQSFDDYSKGIRQWVNWSRIGMASLDTCPEIETASDIHQWFLQLYNFGIMFHPDNDFKDYNGIPEDDVAHLDGYLEACWDICTHEDLDIYEIAQNAWNEFDGV